jgi:hypothetical protein
MRGCSQGHAKAAVAVMPTLAAFVTGFFRSPSISVLSHARYFLSHFYVSLTLFLHIYHFLFAIYFHIQITGKDSYLFFLTFVIIIDN